MGYYSGNKGLIIGGVVAGVVVAVLLTGVAVYAYLQQERRENKGDLDALISEGEEEETSGFVDVRSTMTPEVTFDLFVSL